MRTTHELLLLAKAASRQGGLYTTDQKNAALLAMADALVQETGPILAANSLDMVQAEGRISPVMLDRLMLDEGRIQAMADGIRQVASLPDPVGRIFSEITRTDGAAKGLKIQKISVPMGVIAIIYESRPNVTSDAAALAIKAGSACILRSGKDAWRSAKAIVTAMQGGLGQAGLDPDLIQLVEDVSRESAVDLMRARGLVDLLIPRGGKGLIQTCVEQSIVPCIETGTGICHIYVDRSADLQKALSIIDNAKTSRPSVCNAAEVLLVHEDAAEALLPALKTRLVDDRAIYGKPPVELRLDEAAARIIPGTPADALDFDTEFLNYILAVKVVPSVQAAIDHIAEHSTHHSDAIVAEDPAACAAFTSQVDSAAVYVNASTRFTDGGEFGLGCEMGISTQKLHARGPMGLEELCSYKYIVTGNGQIR